MMEAIDVLGRIAQALEAEAAGIGASAGANAHSRTQGELTCFRV